MKREEAGAGSADPSARRAPVPRGSVPSPLVPGSPRSPGDAGNPFSLLKADRKQAELRAASSPFPRR